MDKQLLKALDNLSEALQLIADSLGKKGDKDAKSDVSKSLQQGNFPEQLKQINIGVKSIKKDTEEILKQQRTLMGISKQKEDEKKTEPIQADPKKESMIKKGVAVILLIAVAVLAIGMAFKLVGKIDFLSVIGLALAITFISIAFEKVAKLNLTMNQIKTTSIALVAMAAAITVSSWIFSLIIPIAPMKFLTAIFVTATFVFIATKLERLFIGVAIMQALKLSPFKVIMSLTAIAAAITVSSWIMSLIRPISIVQAMTAVFIAATFAFISFSMEKMLLGVGVFARLRVSTKKIVTALVSISIAITLSSWILQFIQPISFAQSMTAILIAIMFSIIGYTMHKVGIAVSLFSRLNVKATDLLKTMLGISLAITASSWILQLVMPVGWKQALTAIVISAMFLIISFNLEKILMGVVAFKRLNIKATQLIMTLVGIATAITVSSWILSLTRSITVQQFLTALGITILFALMSYVMDKLAIGIVVIEKFLGKGKIILIPITLIAIATAIMLSAWILSVTPVIPFMQLLRILAISVILSIAVVLIGVVAAILIKVIGLATIVKGAVAIVILATAIFVSSLILSKGKYGNFPPIEWSIYTAISILAFGIVSKVLTMLGGPATYIKGGLAILIIAVTIVATAFIFSKGSFGNYPKMGWILGVVLSIGLFSVGMLALGFIVSTGVGAVALLAGAVAILVVAATILATSFIFSKGNYTKFPTIGWTIGAILSLATFSIAMVALGALAMTGVGAFALGLGAPIVLVVAATIVATSKVLAKGKYDVKGILPWAMATALLYATFVPAMVALGVLGMASGVLKFFGAEDPFEVAKRMMIQIAETIVLVSYVLQKGKYVKGPNKEWAEGVGIAIGAFSPVYSMLMKNSVMKIFGGGGIGPTDFARAIIVVSMGIIKAAEIFSSPSNKGVWKKGPTYEWALGVGTAIAAFAPVLDILERGSIMKMFGGKGIDAKVMKGAIIAISEGIITAAQYFASPKNKMAFTKDYPPPEWGIGVGAALAAFSPVFEALSGKGWFKSGKEVIDEMKYGIVQIADAVIQVAYKLTGTGRLKPDWKSYPTPEWSDGIRNSIIKFQVLYSFMNKDKAGMIGFKANSIMLASIVETMVKTARLLSTNSKFFKFKMDPNFVQNIAGNLKAVAKLSQELGKTSGGGGVKGFFNRMIGNDPISLMANGMIQLAKAYDQLGNSLKKFGASVNAIDAEKLSLVRRLSGNIALLSMMDATMFARMMTVLESKSYIFNKLLEADRPKSVGEKKQGGDEKSKAGVEVKPGKKDMSGQLDEIIKVLKQISYNTSGLDDYLATMGIASDKKAQLD